MPQPLQVQPFRSAIGTPVGTYIGSDFPQAADSYLAGKYGSVLPQPATQNPYRYGVGGPEQQPGQGMIAPPPGTNMPPSAEQSRANVDATMNALLEHLRKTQEREDDPEVMRRRSEEALWLMNQIGDKQQELGWKSNLIGFALKELPRVMTEPARRRNRYLDDMVLNSPGIAQGAAGMFTGQAIPNYAMGI